MACARRYAQLYPRHLEQMRRAKELRRYLETLLNSDPVGAFLSSPRLHDLLQARADYRCNGREPACR